MSRSGWGCVVLAREALLSVVTLVLAVAGARRIDVQWVGKAGTLALMFALPLFVLVDELDPSAARDVIEVVTWLFTIGGLILSYYAAAPATSRWLVPRCVTAGPPRGRDGGDHEGPSGAGSEHQSDAPTAMAERP